MKTSSTPAGRKARKWVRIAAEVPAALSEWAAGCLAELTGSGVETQQTVPARSSAIPDARDTTSIQSTGEREIILAYVDLSTGLAPDMVAADFLAKFATFFPDAPKPSIEQQEVVEEDWGSTWKKHFKPLHVTPKLVVKPTWEDYPPAAGEKVINIDPGFAFGTGHHDSTRFALQLLEEVFVLPERPATMLDVGCGSGILAIAAAIWGAPVVEAIDNDPDAIEATLANIAANPMAARIKASLDDLASLSGPYDLVAANIIHEVLTAMVGDFSRLLKPGGHLVMAGILRGWQEETLRELYLAHGFVLRRWRHSEEWVAFLFQKRMP